MVKCALLINIFIIAAVSVAARPSYTFTRYLERNGIPTTTVEKIIQDNDGYLWMATWSGLYRFDGIDFINFRRGQIETRTSPAQGRLTDMQSDAYNQLWLLSQNNALYRFNPADSETDRPTAEPVTSCFKISETDFRFVTDKGKILRTMYSRDGAQCTLEECYALRGNETVKDIFADDRGNMWILTDMSIRLNGQIIANLPGFCHCNGTNGLLFGSSNGKILKLTGGKLVAVGPTVNGDVTILVEVPGRNEFIAGSQEGGLFCLDADFSMKTEIGGNDFFSGKPIVQTDHNGNIWIYSEKGGLNWYDSEKKTLVPFYNSSLQGAWDSETYVNSMLVDNQDNLWISGSWGGLERASLNSGEFRLVKIDTRPDAPEESNDVRAVFQSRTGMIYVATMDDKIHLFDTGFNEKAVWPSSGQVYSIAETRDGTIWLGSKGGGITENAAKDPEGTEYQPVRHTKGEDYYAPNCELVYNLNTQDPERIWVSSFDGSLSYIDVRSGRRDFISRKNLISFPTERLNMVRYSCFGPDGKLYACGNLGVFVCDDPHGKPENMKFRRFSQVKDYDIQHLLFTRDGRLWASSSGNGFISFASTDSDSQIKFYTTGSGIMSNFVLSAIQDNDGNIWIASNGGLNKFNPETGSIIGYSYSRMGLDVTFNEGEPIMAYDGNIYFNTNRGLMYFNPEKVSNSSYVPRIIIRSMTIPGKRNTPDSDGKIRMAARDMLNISFSAIDLTAPEQVLYYYMLEGRDKEWNDLGTNPAISLEGLIPGKYTLRLRSTNADGLAVDNEKDIEIIVGRGPLQYIVLFLLLIGSAAAAALSRKSKPQQASAAMETEEALFRKYFASWITEHLDDGDLDIAAMASAMNMSRSALFEKCRTYIGMAPAEYLRSMRFQKATEMLASGAWSISQIAYATGFNDSHYFSKAFKQKFGMTPSAFRKARMADSAQGRPPAAQEDNQ